jgi:hypothetical protein
MIGVGTILRNRGIRNELDISAERGRYHGRRIVYANIPGVVDYDDQPINLIEVEPGKIYVFTKIFYTSWCASKSNEETIKSVWRKKMPKNSEWEKCYDYFKRPVEAIDLSGEPIKLGWLELVDGLVVVPWYKRDPSIVSIDPPVRESKYPTLIEGSKVELHPSSGIAENEKKYIIRGGKRTVLGYMFREMKNILESYSPEGEPTQYFIQEVDEITKLPIGFGGEPSKKFLNAKFKAFYSRHEKVPTSPLCIARGAYEPIGIFSEETQAEIIDEFIEKGLPTLFDTSLVPVNSSSSILDPPLETRYILVRED